MSNFEREPLVRPFGFKGGYLTEIWQTAAMLESESGHRAVGLCSQSVLWSDASVFTTFSEAGGNALMYALTDHALQLVKQVPFETPIELLDEIYPKLYDRAKAVTNNHRLRKTFVLNALVSVDNAAWLIYAKENGLQNFDDMIPEKYRIVFSHRHRQLACIPLMAYAIPLTEITEAVEQGYFFMKIKIGQPGTEEEMLEKDKARVAAIHQAIGHCETPYTKNGKLPYYFDANGRYEKKETLQRFLDYTKSIGAFDQIAIIEEPFPEENEEDLSDLGVCIAADESAHTDGDVEKRIQMGYGAVALKAIAKTLSMTLKVAKVAHDHKVPAFCADLTVNPILVDWNKNVAARLAPFPGLKVGLLETNGHQNYKHWQTLVSYHPCAGVDWMKVENGLFDLGDDFYRKSGGIFLPSKHYQTMCSDKL